MNHQTPEIRLAPFDSRAHLPVVEDWLKRPHVERWWGDPNEAIAAIQKHPGSSSAIIYWGSAPIGYLCWQVPAREELAEAGLADLPEHLVDIDIMIGEPTALGRGLGPEALSRLFTRLRAEGVRMVGIATADANRRARRAFEKAGFQLFRVFSESGEEMRYLVTHLDNLS